MEIKPLYFNKPYRLFSQNCRLVPEIVRQLDLSVCVFLQFNLGKGDVASILEFKLFKN